jgi:hypothetical protein
MRTIDGGRAAKGGISLTLICVFCEPPDCFVVQIVVSEGDATVDVSNKR